MSGGQRQRLALARALLADPALLILDEPTAHLDPDSRRALTRDLLQATAGRTTLLITHDLDGLDQVDEIVVLRHGKVVRRGSYGELSHAADLPATPGTPDGAGHRPAGVMPAAPWPPDAGNGHPNNDHAGSRIGD
jgi:ABC-type transport system involved in cytochrome bd biosynthesis fused ATPase/permease subunit